MTSLRRAIHLAALGALLVLAGCGKKLTTVDPHFVPEGRTSPDARLYVWNDLPVSLFEKNDMAPPGKSDNDTVVKVVQKSFYVTGTVHGLILDGTPASGYQVFRQEPNGGFRALTDFTFQPLVRFPSTGWELYRFDDGNTVGLGMPTYLGRGLVNGVVTSLSPLTNPADVTPGTVPEDIRVRFSYHADTAKWAAVSGAVGYLVQNFTFLGTADQEESDATPQPLSLLGAHNLAVQWIDAPAGADTVTWSPAQAPTRTTMARFNADTISIQSLLRISAFDADARLIAFTYGDRQQSPPFPDVVPITPDSSVSVTAYYEYRRGSYVVELPYDRLVDFNDGAPQPGPHGAVRPSHGVFAPPVGRRGAPALTVRRPVLVPARHGIIRGQ